MRGATVGRTIKSRIRTLEDEHARLSQDCAATEARIEGVRSERQRLFAKLSSIYLPELGSDSVQLLHDRLPELGDRIAAIVEEKREATRRIERKTQENRSRRSILETDLERLTESLEAKAEERDALTEQFQERLYADPHYVQLVRDTKQASERVLQNQRRLDAAENERNEKRPAYEADPLFSYLRERHYDTPDYAHRGLTAKLDAWVAGRVDYENQSQNYTLLIEVPEVVKREIEKSRIDLQAKGAETGALEAKVAADVGLTQVTEEGERLYDLRMDLLEKIVQVDAEFEGLLAERTTLENTRGEYYKQALVEYGRFLETREVEQLRALARSTETRADDGITGILETLEGEIPAAEKRLASKMLERKKVADQLHDLLELDLAFHQRNYDASNSVFDDSLKIGAILSAIVAGASTVEKALQILGRSHRVSQTQRKAGGITLQDILWTAAEIGVEVARSQGGGRGGGWNFGGGSRNRSGGRRGGRSGSRSGGGTSRRSPGPSRSSSGTGGFRGFGGRKSKTTGGFG